MSQFSVNFIHLRKVSYVEQTSFLNVQRDDTCRVRIFT